MNSVDGWTDRAETLRAELVASGKLTSSAWAAALLAVPRHAFVSAFYEHCPGGGWEVVSAASPDTRSRWLDAVYANRSLVTQVGAVPDGGRDRTGPTSSSSAPGLMVRMLETLEVRPGDRVLEIGTGTGYNAALLSHELGDENVFSIDVDPELVEHARNRLAEIGFRPHLVATDGATGLAEGAPYECIIATCAVSRVPWVWAEQTTHDGRVLVDLKIHAVVGNLVLLHRHKDRLEGWFDRGQATFMHIRSPRIRPVRTDPVRRDHSAAVRRTTREELERVWEIGPLWFLLHLGEPGRVEFGYAREPETGLPGPLFLVSQDGSWCEVSSEVDGTRMVVEGGPRRLWAAVEDTARFWRDQGRPGWDRFGLTVLSDDEQYVWLDRPDSTHRWYVGRRT